MQGLGHMIVDVPAPPRRLVDRAARDDRNRSCPGGDSAFMRDGHQLIPQVEGEDDLGTARQERADAHEAPVTDERIPRSVSDRRHATRIGEGPHAMIWWLQGRLTTEIEPVDL